MNNNKYLKDSLSFFKVVSLEIREDLSKEDIIKLTIYLAFGLERLLKGILYSANPLYILKNPDFKNSLPICYSDKILKEVIGSKEIATIPDEDVITFRNSLLKAQLISKVTYENKALLFSISNARDIIAHHELSKLDYKDLKILLLRDYYPLMKGYVSELGFTSQNIFHGKQIQLAKISSKYQGDVEKQIDLKFEALRSMFKTLSKTPGYIADKEKLTREALELGSKFLITCPCCEKNALIYAKPIIEYNQDKKAEIKIGYDIIKLKCFYCKLEIEDYKQLDYLQISVPSISLRKEGSTCSRCSLPISSDNATGFCSNCDEFYGTQN